MSGFDDSDFKRLLGIIERTESNRENETVDFTDSCLSYPCDRMVSGLIFVGEKPDLIFGNIYIENGIIKEIEEAPVKSENWIVPRFVNTHTHIGDTLLKDPPLGNPIGLFVVQRDLDALVKPPNGLKHRFLAGLEYEAAVSSMESAIWDMYQNGISVFADFREGGISGAQALIEAVRNTSRNIHPIIFGRPANMSPSVDSVFSSSLTIDFLDELRDLLEITDGIGVSGANDLNDYLLSKISSKTASKRKKLAVHAGEKDRKDIDAALSLHPDMLIHMTHADPADIKKAADADIPVSVCVRSNLTTGVGLPPVPDMLQAGIRVSIGTDNMMLNSPDMFEEIHFLSKIYGLSDKTIFKMATSSGADTLGCRFTGTIDVGKKADLLILNSRSENLKYVRDPLAGYARRAGANDILGII